MSTYSTINMDICIINNQVIEHNVASWTLPRGRMSYRLNYVHSLTLFFLLLPLLYYFRFIYKSQQLVSQRWCSSSIWAATGIGACIWALRYCESNTLMVVGCRLAISCLE
jgi:hypothetical protein